MNIFRLKSLLIPYHSASHWSLFVIVNLDKFKINGRPDESSTANKPWQVVIVIYFVNRFRNKSDSVPYFLHFDITSYSILFLDSLKYHDPLPIANKIRDYLDEEWDRKINKGKSTKTSPFNFRTLPLVTLKGEISRLTGFFRPSD